LKVLIVGSGAREHAIAGAFARSPKVKSVIVTPGNAGIATEFDTIPIPAGKGILGACENLRPDLVFIGPEGPLAEGWADLVRGLGIPCIGPSREAARIETSKIFARNLMHKYNIPSAEFQVASDLAEADRVLADSSYPIVIKADGLAAGKGVIIAHNTNEARSAARKLLDNHNGGKGKVLIEEFLQGWEVSLFAFTDSVYFKTTIFSQDHKQLLDGDRGPNTGGMGAFAPVPEAEAYRAEIEDRIIGPVLKAMRDEGCPFTGILYCGLMITADGPKVVEFNCRLGDPETQAVLPLLETDFVDVCEAMIQKRVDSIELKWRKASSVAVVLAAGGYPEEYEKGHVITLRPGVQSDIYYSGVALQSTNLVSNGGRVLTVSAQASDLECARELAYKDVNLVDFDGKIYRGDISMRLNTCFSKDGNT
jgi:phosphoribosylamine--glycine ligase